MDEEGWCLCGMPLEPHVLHLPCLACEMPLCIECSVTDSQQCLACRPSPEEKLKLASLPDNSAKPAGCTVWCTQPVFFGNEVHYIDGYCNSLPVVTNPRDSERACVNHVNWCRWCRGPYHPLRLLPLVGRCRMCSNCVPSLVTFYLTLQTLGMPRDVILYLMEKL